MRALSSTSSIIHGLEMIVKDGYDLQLRYSVAELLSAFP